ncbi:hypothetical protein THRCLA_01930 [Thraustotheca clavata]|uniref:FYVE-type domain-containing protein n=1 Tax=Thraustotheca clavata TaxID=74557 RepID=A0A1W0A705_9STRA|nr:hypothetical protein THRCLA_01930 [Thraustotheca clavata]
MRVLGLPKKLFREGSSSPSKGLTINGPLVMPNMESVDTEMFPTNEQRSQLQSMGKQSCTSLKRVALSMAMLRESWEKMDTENNMEMYHLKDNEEHDGTIHVCGVTHVHATLGEILPLLQLPKEKEYTMDKKNDGVKTLVNEMFASQTLVSVDEQTSIQWLAMKSVDNMIHRDFVVLQRMDHFTKDDDIEIHTISLHSMDFPGAPPQFDQVAVTTPPDAYRFIRGGMYRSGFVILEDANRPGVLDVFGLFKVDFKGDKQQKLFRSTLTQWLHFLGNLNQHFLSEKLHAKGAPRIRQAPSTGIKSKAKRCECCNLPFKFQLQFRAPVRDQCLMCGAIICSSCKIDYKPKEEEEKNQVFCIPCLVKWNPDTTKSIKFIQPTNLPGQNPSPRPAPINTEGVPRPAPTNTEGVPLLAEIPVSPPTKTPVEKPSLSPSEAKDHVSFDAPLGEPRLRSEMHDGVKPRRRSDGREESHWPIRGERSYSVPEASRPATSIAIMDTINLDSLDYRVSLYGRFSISTASKSDLEARLEWIIASIQAMETTISQFTKDGKLRRAMQVIEEKNALQEERLQVQAALDAFKDETRDSMQEDLESKYVSLHIVFF